MVLVRLVDSDVLFVMEVVTAQNVKDMGFHSKVPKRMKTGARVSDYIN